VTKTEELPAIEERILLSGIGEGEFTHAFLATSSDVFFERIGLSGLNWIIASVLAKTYPAVVFDTDGTLYETWGGEHGGEDIEPGMKWLAALRLGLEVVNREK